MDRGAWRATVHGVAKRDMTEQLSTHIARTKVDMEHIRFSMWTGVRGGF